ncbi:FAD-binding domain-containing protein [Stereum hirsutum FP-91666 SS1]|uniref:FAD-binding domain-containing protein n=1 Tax=Stereum hirsutum (strain FP-91666) TaxID=721885 RepID=UPI000440BC1B|nr:FAD-binding domain-containing protein [Stereum hirsutum FP-91666 SS1]EIM88913.1 FAD-binding domain-containing protein [Stereum hirsutum FP-91666 SS1]
MATLLAFSAALASVYGVSAASSPYASVTASQWAALNSSVNGRLATSVPIAQPCFDAYSGIVNSNTLAPDSEACSEVQSLWTNTTYRVTQFGTYEQIWSERLNGSACDLDALDPTDPAAMNLTCTLGSIPPYYIDVTSPEDIQAALTFSNQTGVPIVIKNTGHDYLGRSSAPGSLALWTKNLLNQTFSEEFVPEGCNASVGRALTNGAGVTWIEAYKVADANNATVVGGAFPTVGASGGWLFGGGHGFLTGVNGVGADSSLQFKVVTPDGVYRIANACQNEDLFWALRGGGSGFGVVLESTIAAHPAYDIKIAVIEIQNITLDAQFEVFRVFAGLREQLAQEGWGGAFLPQYTDGTMAVTMINPTLTDEQAAATFAPVIDYVNSINGTDGILVTANGFVPGGSYLYLQENYISTVPVGLGAFIGSRLLPLSSFTSNSSLDELITAMKSGLEKVGPGEWPPMEILMDTPLLTPDSNNETSVNPVWRSSAFVMVYGVSYEYNATAADELALMQTVHDALDYVRAVTPGSGEYNNEADILQEDWQEAYWGVQYPALLAIKQKYDPYNLLTGWQYVGFDKGNSMFDRYNI